MQTHVRCELQQQGESHLGHALGRVGGYVGDDDAVLLGGLAVDDVGGEGEL